MDDYENLTIPEYFQILNNEPVNSPKYSIAQGKLYDNIRKDVKISNLDAANISRLLNKGEVDQAQEQLQQMLEPEK